MKRFRPISGGIRIYTERIEGDTRGALPRLRGRGEQSHVMLQSLRDLRSILFGARTVLARPYRAQMTRRPLLYSLLAHHGLPSEAALQGSDRIGLASEAALHCSD
jgi:hypothetical protein